jgi:hypothetical protein
MNDPFASGFATTDVGSEVLPAWQMRNAPVGQRLGGIVLVVISVVALAAVGYAIAYEAKDPVDRAIATGIGALAVALLAVGAYTHRRHGAMRYKISGHERGFVLERAGKRTAIAFTDVRALSSVVSEELSNGTPAGYRRRLVVESAGDTHRFEDFDPQGTSDRYFEHVIAGVAAAWDKLKAPVVCGPITLEPDAIVTRRGSLPYASIAAAGVFDKTLDLWSEGEERPFERIAITQKNAAVAERLLAARVPKKDSKPSERGRLLFTRRSTAAIVVLIVLAAIIASFAGTWAVEEKEIPALFILAPAVAILAASIGWGLRARTEFFTLGVQKRGLFSERYVAYKDVTALTYGATRMYHNGAYTGTTIRMGLKSDAATINVTVSTRKTDDAMERIRSFVSDIVAVKILDALKGGSEISWMPNFFLTKDGVRFFRSKLFGKGDEERHAWTADLRYRIHEGSFELFLGEEKKSAFNASCAGANFYPGLAAFLQLAGTKGRG